MRSYSDCVSISNPIDSSPNKKYRPTCHYWLFLVTEVALIVNKLFSEMVSRIDMVQTSFAGVFVSNLQNVALIVAGFPIFCLSECQLPSIYCSVLCYFIKKVGYTLNDFTRLCRPTYKSKSIAFCANAY